MLFDPRSLIDPVFFSRLESIELRARSIVEGSMHGLHRSPYLGLSVEFASHREYTPGDDLRHLNWKLYARHDRLYIKEYDADTNLNLYLLLDASASMSCANAGRSKLHYAASLAAALAHLALKQRDAVGLTVFSDAVTAHLPLAPSRTSSTRSWRRSPPPRSARRPTTTAPCTRRPSSPAGAAWSSSSATCFGDLDTIVGGLDHLRYSNHEVIIFHIMDPWERDLSVDGQIRFRDLESGETLTTQAEGIREAYLEAVDEWRQALELECRKRAIDRIELTTQDPPDRALLDYLVRRAKTF